MSKAKAKNLSAIGETIHWLPTENLYKVRCLDRFIGNYRTLDDAQRAEFTFKNNLAKAKDWLAAQLVNEAEQILKAEAPPVTPEKPSIVYGNVEIPDEAFKDQNVLQVMEAHVPLNMRDQLARYLTSQFIVTNPDTVPADECREEAEHILKWLFGKLPG